MVGTAVGRVSYEKLGTRLDKVDSLRGELGAGRHRAHRS